MWVGIKTGSSFEVGQELFDFLTVGYVLEMRRLALPRTHSA